MAHIGASITGATLLDRGADVAVIAGTFASDIGREGRFPQEAIAAMKRTRLLGAMLPVDCGGEGASLREIAEICAHIAQSCGSAGMIFALHQIQVSSLLLQAETNERHRDVLRQIADAQLLLTGATLETGHLGDLRRALSAVQIDGDIYRLQKIAAAIPYGADADAILATARLAPDSQDHALVVVSAPHRTLEATSAADGTGLRGVTANGFKVIASGPISYVLPKAVDAIAAHALMATSHLLWSAVGMGIARAIVETGQASTDLVAMVDATSQLDRMVSIVGAGLNRFERASADELASIDFAAAMKDLKVATSRLGIEIANGVTRVCGVATGRHYREMLDAQIMINNDRLAA